MVWLTRFGPSLPFQPHLALCSPSLFPSSHTGLVSCSLLSQGLSQPTSSVWSVLPSPTCPGNSSIRSNFPTTPIKHSLHPILLICSSDDSGGRFPTYLGDSLLDGKPYVSRGLDLFVFTLMLLHSAEGLARGRQPIDIY